MDLGDDGSVTHGEHLAVDGAAADDEDLFISAAHLHGPLGGMGQFKAGDGNVLPGQEDVPALGQGLLAREGAHGLSAHDDRGSCGGLAEKFPVGTQRDGLVALIADAPVVINCYDQFHK